MENQGIILVLDELKNALETGYERYDSPSFWLELADKISQLQLAIQLGDMM